MAVSSSRSRPTKPTLEPGKKARTASSIASPERNTGTKVTSSASRRATVRSRGVSTAVSSSGRSRSTSSTSTCAATLAWRWNVSASEVRSRSYVSAWSINGWVTTVICALICALAPMVGRGAELPVHHAIGIAERVVVVQQLQRVRLDVALGHLEREAALLVPGVLQHDGAQSGVVRVIGRGRVLLALAVTHVEVTVLDGAGDVRDEAVVLAALIDDAQRHRKVDVAHIGHLGTTAARVRHVDRSDGDVVDALLLAQVVQVGQMRLGPRRRHRPDATVRPGGRRGREPAWLQGVQRQHSHHGHGNAHHEAHRGAAARAKAVEL